MSNNSTVLPGRTATRWWLAAMLMAATAALAACSGGGSGPNAPQTVQLVSIGVTPANASIPNPGSRQFTATGVYSDHTTLDLTTSVTWSSSLTAVAAVSNATGTRGLASAQGTGTTTITATAVGGLVSGSTSLTVTAATLVSIAVTPVDPFVAAGSTQAFVATGTY